MADYGPRTYLRDANGPRAVASSREQMHISRHGRDSEDRSYSRSKRSNEKKSKSKHDTSRNKPARIAERPSLRLDIINQPSKAITLGVEVSTSVLVSLAFSHPDSVTTNITLDRSRLLGLVSVVAETHTGERVPMEADTIVAEQLFDTLRSIPQDNVDRLIKAQPCRIPLGFLAFSDLLIRQAGQYRIRVSLLQVPSTGLSPVTIATLDTDMVKVTRDNHVQQRYRS